MHCGVKSYKAPYLGQVLRCAQNTAPFNFLKSECIVDLFMDITVKGFGKPHTNFGVLLPMHAWAWTVSNLGCMHFLRKSAYRDIQHII